MMMHDSTPRFSSDGPAHTMGGAGGADATRDIRDTQATHVTRDVDGAAAGQQFAWMAKLAGRFIVFDGPDGSGKSTQFRKLASLVSRVTTLEICEVREPGGTYVGEEIRRLLLDPQNQEDVDVRCEMLLFMASRAQLVQQKLRPAIAQGKLILADRFISSTLAYQGAAGGLSTADILSVGRFALNGVWPDLFVIFDVDEKTAATRLNPLLDRMELKSAAFHRRVRQGYLDQASADPEHYVVIDATADAQQVTRQLLEALRTRLCR